MRGCKHATKLGKREPTELRSCTPAVWGVAREILNGSQFSAGTTAVRPRPSVSQQGRRAVPKTGRPASPRSHKSRRWLQLPDPGLIGENDLFCPQAGGKNPVKDDGVTVPISTIVKRQNLNVGLPAVQHWNDDLDCGASAHGALRVANPRDGRLVLEGNVNTLTLESGTNSVRFLEAEVKEKRP